MIWYRNSTEEWITEFKFDWTIYVDSRKTYKTLFGAIFGYVPHFLSTLNEAISWN